MSEAQGRPKQARTAARQGEGAPLNEPVPVSQRAAPSFGRSLKTVAWSFLGIRKGAEFQQDLARVNPMHIILVGFVAVLVMVVGLMVLVNWVVAK
jgi:hypothetical protein